MALAGELGLNLRDFEACLESDNTLKRVKARANEAEELLEVESVDSDRLRQIVAQHVRA